MKEHKDFTFSGNKNKITVEVISNEEIIIKNNGSIRNIRILADEFNDLCVSYEDGLPGIKQEIHKLKTMRTKKWKEHKDFTFSGNKNKITVEVISNEEIIIKNNGSIRNIRILADEFNDLCVSYEDGLPGIKQEIHKLKTMRTKKWKEHPIDLDKVKGGEHE